MSDNTLKVAILPLDIAWGDVNENIYQLDRALDSLPEGADIVVLPELFTTGFTTDPVHMANLAERSDGPTMMHIKDLASRHNAAFAGSYLATDGHGEYYNRGFFVEPSGDATYYDKHHLFKPSGEADVITAGQTLPPVIRYRGWDVRLIVCYDLRFPVWCAAGATPYDVLLVPANWGAARRYAWDHLLIARAIENQAYVVGANRSGEDDYGQYTGTTAVYDTMGKLLAGDDDSNNGNGRWVVASLSKKSLENTRRRIPSLKSADKFSIEL